MLVRRVWPSRPTFEGSFSDFDQIRREMLRLFDAATEGAPDQGAGVFPPMNITQDDDNFYLRAELPGIKPAELAISRCGTASRSPASGRSRASTIA